MFAGESDAIVNPIHGILEILSVLHLLQGLFHSRVLIAHCRDKPVILQMRPQRRNEQRFLKLAVGDNLGIQCDRGILNL